MPVWGLILRYENQKSYSNDKRNNSIGTFCTAWQPVSYSAYLFNLFRSLFGVGILCSVCLEQPDSVFHGFVRDIFLY